MSSNRNKPCICGSRKKFKYCCMEKIPKAKARLKEMLKIDRESLMKRIYNWNMSHHPFKLAAKITLSWYNKFYDWIKNIIADIKYFFTKELEK